MRSKWQLVLFIGLIVSLANSVIGCGESYTQKDLEGNYEALLLENTLLKSKLETTEADVAYLRDASKTLRDDFDILEAEHNTLKTDYAVSEATSKKLQAAYDTLKDDYDALKVLCDDVSNELAELKKSSEPEPESTSTSPDEAQVITDLAYIKISVGNYTDDADLETDGITLNISFYDSNSEGIIFQGIPVEVTIKLYGYKYTNIAGSSYNFPDMEKRELVHQEQATLDYSVTIGSSGSIVTTRQIHERISEWEQEHNTTLDLSSTEIKMPFEDMMVDPNTYYKYGDMEVTVITPKQGSYQATQGLVGLYAED